ncbi:MAG: DUF86 domain-containing protein [Cyanothece sp. SIO2G6]|nr:DUF86 domain-containing protein [Cyanothece sp. SIO2G6]
MSPSTREYLQHILDEAVYLQASSTSIGKAEFVQDETLKRAYVRSLEIIGEAAKKIPLSLCQKYSGIEWRLIAGMRDGATPLLSEYRLIHNYFGVDYDIVWDVITYKIPALETEIRTILKKEYGVDR